jgi:hypothetical protein
MIVSLLSIILVFYFFPRFKDNKPELLYYAPVIEMIDIPQTRQNQIFRPPPSKPVIPVQDEEIEFLDQVNIEFIESDYFGDSLSYSEFKSGLPVGYKPRQLLEVVPQNVNETFRGEIVLQLKIDRKGKVIDHRLVYNSTNSEQCLEYAIEAAKKSLWEAAMVDGRPIEYWIEKTYRFNM